MYTVARILVGFKDIGYHQSWFKPLVIFIILRFESLANFMHTEVFTSVQSFYIICISSGIGNWWGGEKLYRVIIWILPSRLLLCQHLIFCTSGRLRLSYFGSVPRNFQVGVLFITNFLNSVILQQSWFPCNFVIHFFPKALRFAIQISVFWDVERQFHSHVSQLHFEDLIYSVHSGQNFKPIHLIP